MGELILNIVTPKGRLDPIACDSIHLTVCDDLSGKGGGSYGIRAGHANALLSLDKGPVKAFLAGRNVLSGVCGLGFASVENDPAVPVATVATVVTVVTEEFEERPGTR